MPFSHKTVRGKRYWWLRERHFTPAEAREFSKLGKQYPALKRMVIQRKGQWASFVREANAKGWVTPSRRKREWKLKVAGFYQKARVKRIRDRESGLVIPVVKDWVVTRDVHGKEIPPTISPWEWYDSVFGKLPDDQKWDSPRTHRVTRKRDFVTADKIRDRKIWISQLKDTLSQTDDPVRAKQLRRQIRRLGGRLS